MFKAIFCSAVAVAALGVCGAAQASPITGSLLVNGNLSNGVAGWSTNGIVSLQSGASASGSGPNSPYLLFAASPGGWISQSVADVAGQLYTLTYNVSIIGGGYAGYAFDQKWVVGHYTTGSYALTYQIVGTGMDTISFNGAGDSAGAAVEESSFAFMANAGPVTQVPEPASLALLGSAVLGLCILLATRRRPKTANAFEA